MTPDLMSDLVALYALDALEGAERSTFEEHLSTCETCRRSLAEYRSVTSTLVYDEPASDQTWDQISTAISEESLSDSNVVPIDGSKPWRWIVGLTAVAAAMLAGFLAVQLLTAAQLTDQSIVVAADRAAQDSDSIVAGFLVDEAQVARVVLTADGRGFVIPEALEALTPDRTYQLWVINGEGEVISAGVLGAEPTPAIFTWTDEVSGFALTREVAGGVVSSAGDVVSVTDGF